MAKALTADGKCPDCNTQITRPYDKDKGMTYYAVNSLIIDTKTGTVATRCARCKTDIDMPVMKMPIKLRKSSHAN